MVPDPYLSSARQISLAILTLGVMSLLLGLDLRDLRHFRSATEDLWVVFRTQELLTKIQQGEKTDEGIDAITMVGDKGSIDYGISSDFGDYIVNVSQARFRNSEPAYFVKVSKESSLNYFVIVSPNERRTALLMWSPPLQPSFAPYLSDKDAIKGMGGDLNKGNNWGSAASHIWETIDHANFFVTDFQHLENAVRTFARKVDVPVTYDETPLTVIHKIREAKPTNPKVLGFELKTTTAVIGIPTAMLCLAFTMLHRLRRFSDMNSLSIEPWLMVYPNGVVEKVAVNILALALIASPLIGFWSVSIIGDPIATYISLSLTVAAFVSVVLALRILFRINRTIH